MNLSVSRLLSLWLIDILFIFSSCIDILFLALIFLTDSQASEELESANSQLESEIAYLTAEREQLEMMLDAHICNMEKAAGRGPAWVWQPCWNVDFTLQNMG